MTYEGVSFIWEERYGKNFPFFFIFTGVIVFFKRKVKSTYISAFQNWKQSRNIFATMIYECKWIKPFWGSYMYLYRTVYFRFWKKVIRYVTPYSGITTSALDICIYSRSCSICSFHFHHKIFPVHIILKYCHLKSFLQWPTKKDIEMSFKGLKCRLAVKKTSNSNTNNSIWHTL